MPKPDLLIFEIEQRLLETLTTQKRLVRTAPTGSGKSTQVPQMLLDGGLLPGACSRTWISKQSCDHSPQPHNPISFTCGSPV